MDLATLENAKECQVDLNEKNQEELKAIYNRDWLSWTSLQGSLVSRYNSTYDDFKKKAGPWIQWHIKVISDKTMPEHNVSVESALGIDVDKRTLPAPAPTPAP